MSLDLRDEPPDGAASRALLEAYDAFVHARLAADGVAPGERFYVSAQTFDAWLVAYADGRPVGCGGLCVSGPGVGEVKRLYVAGAARGRGYGRLLLRALEARAAALGVRRLRMLTAEALGEAGALYAAEGYAVLRRVPLPGGPVELELEKALHS